MHTAFFFWRFRFFSSGFRIFVLEVQERGGRDRQMRETGRMRELRETREVGETRGWEGERKGGETSIATRMQ
jgi:hypothetical protein